MGGRSSNSGLGNASRNATVGGLSPAQAEEVSRARDYNREVIEDFSDIFAGTYDDRAYTDPYFDIDEYEENMNNLIRDARQVVANMREEASNKNYRYWSADLERQETLDAARLEEIINDYERDYRRQRLNSRRY